MRERVNHWPNVPHIAHCQNYTNCLWMTHICGGVKMSMTSNKISSADRYSAICLTLLASTVIVVGDVTN